MTTITFATKIQSTHEDNVTLPANEYEQWCRMQNCYEVIPDDRPVKLYFDIDVKETYDPEIPNWVSMMPNIIDMAEGTIRDFAVNRMGVNPRFCIGSANSNRFLCSKYKIDKCVVSLHIIVDNVIVMKSDQKRLVSQFNQYANKKYSYDLPDYIGEGNSLFDDSVYDKNRKMRSLYATKEGENRPFKLEKGTFEQSCISAFIPDDAVLFELPPEPVSPVTVTPVLGEVDPSGNRSFVVSAIKNGLLTTYAKDYNTWIKVGFALHREFGKVDGWELMDSFSKLHTKGKSQQSENKDWWDGLQDDHTNPCTMGTIVHLCNLVDRVKTKALLFEANSVLPELKGSCLPALMEAVHTPEIKVITEATKEDDALYISLETLEKGENDIGRHITKTLIKTLVFCNNHWFLSDKQSGLWRIIQKPSAIVITTVQTYIDKTKISLLNKKLATDDEEEKKKLTNYEKKYNEFYKQVGKGAFTNQIINILQTYLFDGEFERKLDTTPYLVAYKNGLYDLKTGLFRSGIKPTDYLTQTIPYNYERATEDDISAVKRELLKICNNCPQHLDYYLSSLGYAMTGDSSREQSFWNIRGQKACNGKSVVFDALINIIPNYIVKMESDIFEVNYGSRHKEISTWKGVRIGYINELSKKRQDENVLKELADGTCMRFKVMYGGMDTMPVTLKLWIVGNSTMKVNADNGIKRRLKMLQFDSEFVTDLDEDNFETCQFKKDLNFGMLLQTKYKHALMELIFQYSKQYADNNYKLCSYPSAWAKESEDVARDNNKFEEYFYNRFEIDPIGTVSKRVMDSIISGYKDEQIIIKDELKKMKIAFTYDSQTRVKGEKTKGCYVGFKEIPYDNVDDEATDYETTEI